MVGMLCNAMHGTNESQRDYIQNYFSNCQPTISPSAPILCPDATDTFGPKLSIAINGIKTEK